MVELGKLAYRFWFQPLGLMKRSIREGGPLEQRRNRLGHIEMMHAAQLMSPLSAAPKGPDAEVHFLSGPRFWHQTVFCFASLQLRCPFRIDPIIYDDGKMDVSVREHIMRVIPWAQLVSNDESEALLDKHLPEKQYPKLRERRLTFPLMRKLLDVHVGSKQWRLFADSDMLFFKQPAELIEWFASPHWMYLRDTIQAYGYETSFLKELAGQEMPEMLNSGLYAINGAEIDWDHVEYWCKIQLETFGTQYLQEQALTAMLFAGRAAQELPRDKYVVGPNEIEGRLPTAVLHHYVDLSKRSYFRHGWKQVDAEVRARI